MRLSRPTNLIFIISLVIAVLAILSGLGQLSVLPIASFWQMGIAYAVLAIVCLFKGA